jgi:DNA-binding response OmpR family regulator
LPSREDERRMAELPRQGLVEEDHTVTVANDGRGGLSLAQAGTFDVIVLDLMLPGMNGLEIGAGCVVPRDTLVSYEKK